MTKYKSLRKKSKKKNIKKGGNLIYDGYCDNHPSQCMQSGSTSCNAGGKKKTLRKNNNKKSLKKGGHQAFLSNYNYKTYSNSNEKPLYTPSKGMPNYLINNDWSQGLGQNPGVTGQMLADSPGPGQGGKKKCKRKFKK